jgi:hypothetical protein
MPTAISQAAVRLPVQCNVDIAAAADEELGSVAEATCRGGFVLLLLLLLLLLLPPFMLDDDPLP